MKRLLVPQIALLLTSVFLIACGETSDEDDRDHRVGRTLPPPARERERERESRMEEREETGPVAEVPPERRTSDVPPPTSTNVPPPPPAQAGNYEYGKPVAGKPGYVTSPYAPYQGYVDVRGFPPGTEVKDPYTGKVFLVPAQ